MSDQAATLPTDLELVEDMTKLAAEFTKTVNYARDLEGKLSQAKSELAAKEAELAQAKAEPVQLQKVAFDDNEIEDTLEVLSQRGVINSDEDRELVREKLANDCNAGLRLVKQVATLRTELPVTPRGEGIAKAGTDKEKAASTKGFGPAKGWLVA